MKERQETWRNRIHSSLAHKEWTKGYDAIIGFSQGAILAAALCARLLETGQRTPRFAIFLSGFGAPTPEGFGFEKCVIFFGEV